MEEKNIDLIMELITQFSPINGSIIDPYGGTITSSIAAIRCKRSAVCIEKDSHCFKLAKDRIIRLLKPLDDFNKTNTCLTTSSSQETEVISTQNTESESDLSFETANTSIRVDGSTNIANNNDQCEGSVSSNGLQLLATCVNNPGVN